MRTKQLNLAIVAENALIVHGLRHFLEDRFGAAVKISSFCDEKSCLKKIDVNTHAVITDYTVDGKKGSEVIKAIKSINSDTRGIYHSSSEDVAAAVRTLLKGEPVIQPATSKYTYKIDEQYSHYYARS